MLSLNQKFLTDFVREHELSALSDQVSTAHHALHSGSCLGSDYLGWLTLPSSTTPQTITEIQSLASHIRSSCQVFIVIGIGGSYLGGRASVDFLRSPNYNQLKDPNEPELYFIGNSLSESALSELLTLCSGKDLFVNVISKSGTTTEPAIAFRIFRQLLIDQYGETEAAKRILCTTDGSKGTLKDLADKNGYQTLVIPDNIGGRFSVLTPVGLLPIAVAGGDIAQLISGAQQAEAAYANPNLAENPCYRYAALRNILLRKGKAIEVFVCYEPYFALLGEWLKQLFGESEGKDHKGLFPASMIFSTDLHSLGQFVQDGSRNLFETIISIGSGTSKLKLQAAPSDFDGLNFLAGMTLPQINQKAMEGTLLAHIEGGTPNLILNVPDRSAHSLGQLLYFFEKACALSGLLLGVNPFDQPGVEDYKKNMFALLGKPGYESRRKDLEAKLSQP